MGYVRAARRASAKSGLAMVDYLYVGPPSFMGGRNVDWAKDMASGEKEGGVRPDQCFELENFDIDEQGILVGRRGVDLINSTALNGGLQIHSMYRYRCASNSTSYFIVQCGTKVYTVSLTTGAATEIASGVAQTPLKWLTWNNKAYGFNGEGIYKYCPTDGTPWQQVQGIDADTPDAKDGTVFEDVLFAAQDGSTYPSRVGYSDEFDAETWSATDFRRVRERDGQEIMSLKRLGARMLCLKDKSAWWLYGGSIYAFAEELISDEIGQVGRMSFATHEDKAFFQSYRGIEYFDPNTPKVFNNIARGTCANEITGLSRSVKNNAVMCYWPLKNRLLISYPNASTPTIYVFFLNHPNIDSDGTIWFPHTIYTGYTVTAMTVANVTGDNGELYWGTDDGYIYKYNYGYSDNGTAITASMKWGFTDCGIPHLVKNFNRAIVPARLTGTLDITLNVDFSTDTQQKTTTAYLPTGVGIWDEGLWDTALWAGTWVATRKVRFNKMNGIKVSLGISYSYQDKIELHPFKIEFYPRESVRMLT